MISAFLDEVPTTRPQPSGASERPHREASSAAEPTAEVPADEDVFVFPATAAQKRFWLLDQLVLGGNSALNMPLALRLRGTLDLRALERALDEIVRRHESLRTTFHCDRGQLLQVITPRQTLSVPLVDVSDFPPEERARVPEHLLAEESAPSRSTSPRGPLLRARLVRLSPYEHRLLCPVHHIVADGWSNGVFVRELGALYAAYAQGRPSPLPEPAIQFADFSQWQSTVLTEGGFEPQLRYWRARLAGTLPVLDLPVDRPRLPWHATTTARRNPRASSARRVDFPAQSPRAGGRRQSRSCSSWRCSACCSTATAGGQEDVLVGTSTANRARLEIESLIGLFVNPLLLRLDLSRRTEFPRVAGPG